MEKILKFCNENHLLVIAAVACLGVFFYMQGCQSKVPSLYDPLKQVTRSELEAEITSFIAQADAKIGDLDRQDEIRKMLLDKAAIFAASGGLNWQGFLNTGISVIAIGSALDQRRKYKNIQQTIANGSQTTTTPTT